MERRLQTQSRFFRKADRKINGPVTCVCGEENPYWAGYCKMCGAQLGQEAHNEAYGKTCWGDLDSFKERIEDTIPVRLYKKCVDNFWAKLFIILICLLPAILIRVQNGFEFKILETPHYSIQYNEQAKEHHLFTEQDEIAVDLYCPGKVEYIETYLIGENDSVEDFRVSQPGEAVVLCPTDTGYVRIVAVYDSGKTERLNVYVFQTD